jgi:lipase chaperone LimK
VRSLEGTRPDGDIQLGADGTLVVDAELERLFDYYLSTVGEKSIDEILAEIERELDRRLKPGPAEGAKRQLMRYLDYKRARLELEQNMQLGGGAVTALRVRFTAMQLRHTRFSTDEQRRLAAYE